MDNNPVVIKRSKGGYAYNIILLVALIGGAIGSLLSNMPLVGGIGLAVIFGIPGLFLLYSTIVCNSPLLLYPDHFEIKSPGITRSFRWRDIDRFELKRAGVGDGSAAVEVVAFFLSASVEEIFAKEHPWATRFERMNKQSGSFRSLPSGLVLNPSELMKLVAKYKTDAL